LFRVFKVIITALIVTTVGFSLPAYADKPPQKQVQIHLVTVGAGSHLFTAAGHACIMVAYLDKAGNPDPARTIVYNYGDADWDDPMLETNFFRGRINFFLSQVGTLTDTIQEFGMRQKREVWRQQLNLSNDVAHAVAQHLENEVKPENRQYRYHHLNAICTTRIRDLINDKLNGELERQLSDPSPLNARDYQNMAFRHHQTIAVIGNLFLGRMHDTPMTRYQATLYPDTMRDFFQTVMVPAPDGSDGQVPLASEPVVLVEFEGGSEPAFTSIYTYYVAGLCFLALLLLGAGAVVRLPDATEWAGWWLLATSTGFGLVGLFISLIFFASEIPELRYNENVFSFLPTDLWLLLPAIQWLREKPVNTLWLLRYAQARTAVSLIVILLHATGVFFQTPILFVACSVVVSAMLWLMARKCRIQPAGSAESD